MAALPNCANYPPNFFVNDPSNCQAYWYCANAQSIPQPDMCGLPYNFDQANQLCNHPDRFPCSNNPTTTPPPSTNPTPPNCANYPASFFVNNPSNCQAYWYCANAQSVPQAGTCGLPYNFDQANQLCNHPDRFPCSDPIPTTSPTFPTPPTTTPTTPTTTPTTTRPTATTTGTTTTFAPPGDFVAVAVREHNYYREIHGVPAVASFNSDINNFAQQWANHLATNDLFEHSNGSTVFGFGENIYRSRGGTTDRSAIIANAIKFFYDEIRFYDFNNPGFSVQAGHFTQLVWKASTEIGVGFATHPDPIYVHRNIVVINYRPMGNHRDQFPENVLRPRSRSMVFNHTLSVDNEMSPVEVMVL